MTTPEALKNRGPAAAPANRAAILAAARELFTERGFQVPLSAIARSAGVGQAVLYRHFPSRLGLALAVFEDNFAELEALAVGDRALARVWRRMVEMTITETAFIEMLVAAREGVSDYDGGRRMAAILAPLVAGARAAGELPDGLGLDDLLLVTRMIHGVSVSSTSPDEAAAAARRVEHLTGLDQIPALSLT